MYVWRTLSTAGERPMMYQIEPWGNHLVCSELRLKQTAFLGGKKMEAKT
jgi:hypothetical protein